MSGQFKLAAAAFAAVAAISSAAPAWAVDNIKPFGDQIRVIDTVGNPVIGYTVTDFGPSSADVAHDGQLYSATLTVQAYGAPANPAIVMFNARAESGEGYRAILEGPDAITAASVPANSTSSGKLYFDVTGDTPNSVVVNDGMRDIFAWIPGVSIGGNRP